MSKVKRTTEEWRELLAGQRASGQTQAEWCAANGINLYTLRDRASRIKRQDREAQARAGQRTVNWIGIKPESLAEAEVQPAVEESPGRHITAGQEIELRSYKPAVTGKASKKKYGSILITRGDWTVMVTADFEMELLAGVLRAVNQICC